MESESEENSSNPPKWAGICQLDLKWKLFEEKPIRFITLGHTQQSKTKAVNGNGKTKPQKQQQHQHQQQQQKQ